MMAEKDYVYGIHPVSEAIESGKEIEKILVRKDSTGQPVKDILARAYRMNIPIQKVPREKLNAITGKNHQGIIAYVSAIPFASLDNIISTSYSSGKDPLLVMLDRITDVHNLGAIARTAEGLGFNALIIPSKGGARLNLEAVRISSGALLHISVCRVKSLSGTLEYIKNNGIKTIAITEKSDTSLYSQDLKGPVCLIFGSEMDGISQELINKADLSVKIPMSGKVSSFNVSASMAIAGAELVRQRTE